MVYLSKTAWKELGVSCLNQPVQKWQKKSPRKNKSRCTPSVAYSLPYILIVMLLLIIKWYPLPGNIYRYRVRIDDDVMPWVQQPVILEKSVASWKSCGTVVLLLWGLYTTRLGLALQTPKNNSNLFTHKSSENMGAALKLCRFQNMVECCLRGRPDPTTPWT